MNTEIEQPGYFWFDEGPYFSQPPEIVPCCIDHAQQFTVEEMKAGVSIHEAGHTVAAFLLNIHVPSVGIEIAERQPPCGPALRVTGAAEGIDFRGHDMKAAFTVLAAGVAAENRWLLLTGRISTDRAFYAERGGASDVGRAQKLMRDNRGGTLDMVAYWQHWAFADRLLSPYWGKVIDLAERMMDGPLSGDDAAKLCGLPNPKPHS